MNREDIMDNLPILLLVIALGVAQGINQTFPEYYQITGWVSFMGILGILGFITAYAKIVATQYPYLEAITYPSKQKLKMYIPENGIESKPMGKANPSNIPLFSTTLTLKYPCNFNPIGKFKRLHIHHEHSPANRFDWKPGKADFKGTIINHPFTETVILYETNKIAMKPNSAEPEPVFILAHAGKDYARMSKGVNDKTFEELQDNETERANKELRQKNVEIGQVHEDVKDLFSGSQRAKTRGTEMVYLVMDDLLHWCVTLERAVKSRPFKILTLPFTVLLVGLTVIVGAFTLWLRPDILTGIGEFFNNPLNMGLLVGVVILGILIGYWLIKRRQ